MFETTLFTLSGLFTLGGALGVCLCRNLMHTCLYLLASFMGVAGLYAGLGADFLAAAQLVIYAGGVVILMLFAVMLTGGSEDRSNRMGLEKIPSMGNKKTLLLSLLPALLALALVVKLVLSVNIAPEKLPPFESTVDKIGILLLSDHVLVFEISSILLLAVLVGACVIARPIRGKKHE